MHRAIRTLLLFLGCVGVLLSASLPVAAAQLTVVHDQKALDRLLGTRGLTLQWIDWKTRGSLQATNENGLVHLKGEQRQPENPSNSASKEDFVEVDGIVTEIAAKEFTFQGRVTTRISYINGGVPCTRQGTYTFRIKGNRKYWRMYPFESPCDSAADYVDIYF